MRILSRLSSRLWDLFCVASVVGIWPRFLEPHCLFVTRNTCSLPSLPDDLEGLRIAHLSDWHNLQSPSYLRKLRQRVDELRPDLVVFTGDWIDKSSLTKPEALRAFASNWNAPLGCFGVLGNHDYALYVTKADDGNFRVEKTPRPLAMSVLQKLFGRRRAGGSAAADAANVAMHAGLVDILDHSSFRLLHNACVQVKKGKATINICGLGDYWLGRCDPATAFQKFDGGAIGIVLTHNPDSLPLLKKFPGEMALCGHTHGGQVNLPWLWRRFCSVEDKRLKRGQHIVDGRWVYVSRGLSAHVPFRLFSPPEIHLITLRKGTLHAKS